VKFEDYYKTLDVARDASADEIKRAYRKRAQKFHPDRNKAADAAEKFSKINEAYEVLKDPETRQKYDQYGENYKAGQEFRPPPGFGGFGGRAGGASGGNSGGGGGFSFEGGDFSEFFQQMFGGTGQTRGGSPFGGGGPQPAREQEAQISISLHEAYHGSTRQITLATGPGLGGGEKKIDVKIPAGVKPGSKIRLKGENLILKINVAPDPRFKISGANLTADLSISPALAALGGKADVETLEGTVTMNIPAGVSSGSRLRLAGKGLAQGDLLVRVLITVPKELSDEQRDLYEKLREMETDSG